MHSWLPLSLTLLAGCLNGSYAIFIQRLNSWPSEAIWLFFSCFAFVIVPIFSITVIEPHAIDSVLHLPRGVNLVLMGGGFLFGIGMIFFTWSMRWLGIGVSFILNVAISTVCGSLVPFFVWHPQMLWSLVAVSDGFALLLFIFSVLLSALACSYRDTQRFNQSDKTISTKHTSVVIIGVFVGVLSGIFCSLQGVSYAFFLAHGVAASLKQDGPYYFPWLVIFLSAFVPYMFYHVVLHARKYKQQIWRRYFKIEYKYHWIYLLLMGLCYFLPLLLYTQSLHLLGRMGPVLAWPLLMSFIVLTANVWSIVKGEWHQAGTKATCVMAVSVVCLVAAIVLLGWGAGKLTIH